jgi:DNA repair exonuclease SbcCD ATPase subunit
MKFGKLRVKNYGPFKKAELDLDRTGITHIKAKNKDAENNNGKATNAAGKSVFFGSIPELHWGRSPTGKDSVKGQQSSEISIQYKDVGPKSEEFDVVRRFGKNRGFSIQRNGKDLHVRTMDLSQRRAGQILGMGEDEFYTRVLIDSLTPHPLLIGSAAQRQEFLVQRFGLHSADSVRKLLLAEYRVAQQKRATYLEVRSLFDDLRSKSLSSDQLVTKRAELEELEAKQEQVLKRFQKSQAVRDLLMFEKDNADLLARLQKVCTVDEFEDTYKDLKKRLRHLEEKQEEAKLWAIYDKELELYKEKVRPLKKQLNTLCGSDWLGRGDEIRKKAKKAKAAADAVRDCVSKLGALPRELQPEVGETPKYDYEACVSKLSRLDEELEHVTHFKDGKCPTCGSSVTARPKSDILADIDKWKTRRAKAKVFNKAVEDLERQRENKALRKELKAQLAEAEAESAKLQKWIEIEELLKQVPDVPSPPFAVRDVLDTSDEKIAKLQKKIAVLRTVKPVLEKIKEVAALTQEQRERAKDFNDLGDKLTTLNNRISNLTAEISTGQSAHQQLQELKIRGKALKKVADDAPLLKAMIDVYSTKGLKKLMIQRCAKKLQDQINKYRKLFFVEDYFFEFKYDKKLEFLVHRKYGKHVSVTDVRKLSGAEKRMFTVLLVVADITLTPKKKRTNLLILDEPEANMGPAAQNAFVKALPVLNKIVPHIVVISPRTDLEIPGANVFTIVKHRGVSSIVKGNAA